MNYRKETRNQRRRLLPTAVLLAACAAALLLTGAGRPADSPARAFPGCPAGAEKSCTRNGKRGTQYCVGAQWGPCMVEDDPGPAPPTGTVRPKFYVLTVLYSPPGTSGGGSTSSVSYGNGSTTGTTVAAGSSFKQNYSVSVSVEAGIGGVVGGSAGASFSYGRNSANSRALDIKKSATSEIGGTGPGRDGIDHDRDIIYLWLNPSVDVTVTPTSANWRLKPNTTADIQYVYVGWLKNPSLMPPGVAQRLQAYGINAQDFPLILSADPLAAGTALDPQRYQIVNTTFPYEPPFEQGDPVPTFKLVLSNEGVRTTTSSVQKDYTLGASASGSHGFMSLYKVSVKTENSWTWSCTNTSGTTAGASESASVTVGGPSFGYTGPTDMAVYYDSLYKTFAFAPVQGTVPALKGSVRGANGRPAAGREVTVFANGVKYRAFTNARGEYRVYGRLSGPLEIKAGGAAKRLPGVPANRVADLTVQ
ncbi:MAG TPA: carboxypeptidase-like regulatory domain-containing protein [Pyrinomonadaceae bacterium]|jgi:hypothetical protein